MVAIEEEGWGMKRGAVATAVLTGVVVLGATLMQNVGTGFGPVKTIALTAFPKPSSPLTVCKGTVVILRAELSDGEKDVWISFYKDGTFYQKKQSDYYGVAEVEFKTADYPARTYKFQAKAKADSYQDSNKVEVKVVEVGLDAISAGNTPDISPLICLNAQTEYKKAKWKATVKPTGTRATVSVTSGGVTVSPTSVSNGDEIEVTGTAIGAYVIQLAHGDLPTCTATGGSDVFRFAKIDTQFRAGQNDGAPGDRNHTRGTDKKNILSVFLPDVTTTPPITSYSPSRQFTATLRIDTEGTSQYTRGVTADVEVLVFEEGEITAGGIMGLDPTGTPISIASGTLSVSTGVSIGGDAPSVVTHTVSAPQFLVQWMDFKAIAREIVTQKNDAAFTGAAFPKSLEVVATSQGEGQVSYFTILGISVHGLAFTGDPDDYEAAWLPVQPDFEDYRIVE